MTPGLLEPGDVAPWFVAATPTNAVYNFNTSAGRYVVLGFLPPEGALRNQALAADRARFDDLTFACYLVAADQATMAAARNQLPGLRWFLDGDEAVAKLFGAVGEAGAHPHWLVLDPSLRAILREPMERSQVFFEALSRLPPPADYAGVPLCAPVLIVPRVFEPETCRRLIEAYEAAGGAPSGVMRDVGGRTIGVLDDFKRRRDVDIQESAFRRELMTAVARRLLPEVRRVFQFHATRMERYIVACYDAAEGGYFRPHRDDETLGTAHRRFACSINLNADFEGGDLRFPEFGPRTYRPPPGGAVVFACGLQHEATPVVDGKRYAFLPFLYDEAGAQLRAANLKFLETSSPT